MMEWLRSQGLTRLPGQDPPASLQGRLRITAWGLQRPAWPILQCTERVRPVAQRPGRCIRCGDHYPARMLWFCWCWKGPLCVPAGCASAHVRRHHRAYVRQTATAVVEQWSGNSSNISSGIVAAAGQSAVAASVAPAEPQEWAAQMGDHNSRLPGWGLLVAGVFVQRMTPAAAPAPQYH